jgi:hypothetical protein
MQMASASDEISNSLWVLWADWKEGEHSVCHFMFLFSFRSKVDYMIGDIEVKGRMNTIQRGDDSQGEAKWSQALLLIKLSLSADLVSAIINHHYLRELTFLLRKLQSNTKFHRLKRGSHGALTYKTGAKGTFMIMNIICPNFQILGEMFVLNCGH